MMPKIIVDLEFVEVDCKNCHLVCRAYGDWCKDSIYRKHCPLFRQPIDNHVRCPACKAAEEAAKRLEEKQ